MGSERLWRESFGRDLDGFLLTPVGPRRTLRFRLSARQSQSGTIGHEIPTLVVWEDRDGSGSGSFWEGYTLISLLRRSSNPDSHVWGPHLTPAVAAFVTKFIEANRALLLAHYRDEVDSGELQRSLIWPID